MPIALVELWTVLIAVGFDVIWNNLDLCSLHVTDKRAQNHVHCACVKRLKGAMKFNSNWQRGCTVRICHMTHTTSVGSTRTRV